MFVVKTFDSIFISKNLSGIFKPYPVFPPIKRGFFVVPSEQLIVNYSFRVAHAKASPPPT